MTRKRASYGGAGVMTRTGRRREREAREEEMADRVGLVRRRPQDDAGRDEEGGADEEEEQVARVPGRRTDPPLEPERLPVAQDRQLALAPFQGADRVGEGSGPPPPSTRRRRSPGRSPAASAVPDARTRKPLSSGVRRMPDCPVAASFLAAEKPMGTQERQEDPEQPPPEEQAGPPSRLPHS